MRSDASSISPPPPFKRSGKAITLAKLLVLGPLAAATIALEERCRAWWPLRFPRGADDLARDSSALARLLTEPSPGLVGSLALPDGATLISQQRIGSLVNEPDKNRTTVGWELTFNAGGRELRRRVVTKFQSGRGMPLYMQAIRAVVERRFHREVEFYRSLAHEVPVKVATPIFADAATSINRVCLVVEHVDAVNPADWRGCALPAMRAMLAETAKLNGAYLRRVTEPQVAWIPARAGLDYAGFVELFIGKASPTVKTVWGALQRYFAERPVTLVHGDCRPGNMLFTGEAALTDQPTLDEDVSSSWPASDDVPNVVMSDWEAINVAPLLWDFTYATVVGLRVADRDRWRDRLLTEFLESLAAAGVDPCALDLDRARLEVDLLAMVLGQVSLAVYENGLWSGQGNEARDLRAWSARVRQAIFTTDTARVAAALSVAPEMIADWKQAIAGRLTPPA